MAYKSTLSSENIQEALDIIHSAVVIGGGILTLDNQSTSEQISSAIGGEDGFNNILGRIRGGNIALGIKVDDTTDNGIIMASIVAPKAENKFTISYLYKGIHYSDEFSLSGSTFSLSQTTEGGGLDSIFQDIQTDSALLESGAIYPIYLTDEKYQEIVDAIKNNKIIRLIFTCGVFYSVSVLILANASDPFVSKIIFGRAFVINNDLSDFTEAKGKSYTVTFSENSDEGHDEPIKAVITAEPDITKEFIEEIYTGNITTHTHDSTYVAQELETDVWDGTSISSSLSGSGTETDPYLIQSCADFAYLHSGNGGTFGTIPDSSFPIQVYFKFTKNLDFQDTVIPININTESIESGMIYGGDYDGNGITVYNFHENVLSNGNMIANMGVIPPNYNGCIHGFNFKNYKSVININNYTSSKDVLYQYVALSPFVPLFTRIYDISINGEVILEGDLSAFVENDPVLIMNYILGVSYLDILNSDYSPQINPKTPFIIDLNVIDNTTNKGDKKIIFFYATLYDFNTLNIAISDPLDDSNIAISEELPPEKNLCRIFMAMPLPSEVYTNSSGYNNCISVSISEGTAAVVQSTPKTLDEMKSEEFANLLNSELPEARLIKDPEGGLPKIASLIPDFDGYVRKSIYDKQIGEINSEIKKFVPVIYIPREIAYTSNANSKSASIYTNFYEATRNLSSTILWKSDTDPDFCITYVLSSSTQITVKFIFENKLYTCISEPDSSGDTWSMTVTSVQIGGSSGGVTADQVLTKTNTTAYTPTQNYHPATKKYVDDNSVSASEVLTKTNTNSYTPTSDYHPATKKFVEDQISNINIPTPSSIPYVESLNDIDEIFAEKAIKAGSFVCGFLNAPTDSDVGDGAGVNREMYNVLFVMDFSDSRKYNKDEMTQTQYTSSVFKFVYDSSNNSKSVQSSKCEFYVDVYGVSTWYTQYADVYIDDDARLYGGKIRVGAETPQREDSELTTVDDCFSDLLELNKENWSRYISRSFAKNSLFVQYGYQIPTDPLYSMYMRVDYLTCDQSGWVEKIGFTKRNDKYEIVLESNNTFSISKIN